MNDSSRPPPTIRRQRIFELLQQTGYVQVSSLVSAMNVSTMTIRRDLDSLSGQGIGSRVRGGLILIRHGDPALDPNQFRARLVAEAHLALSLAQAQRALSRHDMPELQRLVHDIVRTLDTCATVSAIP